MQALTRLPGSSMSEANCELTYVESRPIDTRLALKQHSEYGAALEALGFRVTRLPALDDFPDSVFLEDTVVVFDELAVLAHPGSAARVGEIPHTEQALRELRPVIRIEPPGHLEGGDVLRISDRVFAGLSSRTNRAGVAQLHQYVSPLGLEVVPVRVTGALHLKTAVTALDNSTLLMNGGWVDDEPFVGLNIVNVSPSEPFAANAISDGQRVLMHAGYTLTREIVESHGYEVIPLDISEFLKAEAGLTCMSVRFR